MRSTTRARTALICLVAALASGACSVGTSGTAVPVAPAPAAVAPAAAPAAVTTPGVEPVGPADTLPKETPGGIPTVNARFGPLTDVRVARQDGFDRIVLQFDSDVVPDYRVAYVAPPVLADPSAEVVPVDGAAFLQVSLSPAGASAWGDRPDSYPGADRIALPGGTAVHEIVKIGDWEATLAWVAGTGGELPFAVASLQNPARLVIDVQQPR